METLAEGGDNAKENTAIAKEPAVNGELPCTNSTEDQYLEKDHYKSLNSQGLISQGLNKEEEKEKVAETQKEQDETSPSEGSKIHGKISDDGRPLCQPCAWYYKEAGCRNAKLCRFCHLCPWEELKNRKKQKNQLLRTQASSEVTGGETPTTYNTNASFPPFDPMSLRRAQSLPTQMVPTEPLKVKIPMHKLPPGLELTTHNAEDSDQDGTIPGEMPQAFPWDNNGEAIIGEFEPPSEGSQQHGRQGPDGRQLCQPCVWINKDSGCDNGKACRYCHLCPQGELKNRKKQKIARIRSQESDPPPAYPGELKHSMTEPVKSTKNKYDGAPFPFMHPSPVHHGHYDTNPYAGNWPPPPWMDLQMPYPPAIDPMSFHMGMQAVLGSMSGMIPPIVPPIVPGAGGPPNMADLPSAIPPGGAILPPPPAHMPDIPTTVKNEDDNPPPVPEDSPRGADAKKIDLEGVELQAPVWQTPSENSLLPSMEFSEPPGLSLEGLDRSEPARIKTWPVFGNDVDLQRVASQASIRTEEIPNDGGSRISWMVDSKKLKGSDKVAVSPPFKIPTKTGTFRMMLVPSAQHERKGGGSFKKAKGRGIVQVKCEDDLADAADSNMILRITVRGGGESVSDQGEELPRGPKEHNFALGGIFGLPQEQEEWDFQKHVDASQTFVVCLEILSQDRSTWPSNIALTPLDASAPAMISTSTTTSSLNVGAQDDTEGLDPSPTEVGKGKESPMEITQNDFTNAT